VDQLPTGTVALCFTDIEASTQLLHSLGDVAYERVLDAHRQLLRESVARHGGFEVHTEGDGTFFVFDSAPHAVRACRRAQDAIAGYQWTDGLRVRVRMGIHLGDATRTSDGDYLGLAVHKAARVSAAAHGGQVLATEEVMRGSSGLSDIAFRDLGVFRLRGFDRATRLYDVCDRRGEATFPPPRAPSAEIHNLPPSRTTFVGRSDELVTLANLVTTTGLLTIVGPGGMGKTRLATEGGIRLADRFDQGVWFVPVATVSSGSELWEAVASSFGIVNSNEHTLEGSVIERLAVGPILVVLDNCEHVIEQCADLVSRCLSACPMLTVIATSREALLLPEENVLRVGSLSPESAIQLFSQRAAQSRPGLVIDASKLSLIASICSRLEYMPLALELAAAHIATTPLEGIAEGLSDTMATLDKTHRRGGDSRQQTLRKTIDWSYDLLPAEDRTTFRRLAAFRGGFTEAAAQTVDGATLDALFRLVGRSLVEVDPEARPPRYRLLEPIRQYAWGLLDAAEQQGLMHAHGAWVCGLAREASVQVWIDRARWQERLEAEFGNISAAIQWSLGAPGDQTALTIVGYLGIYWFTIGRGETLSWIAQALEPTDVPPKLRAGALLAGAAIAQLRPLEPWLGTVPEGEAPGFVRSAVWAKEATQIFRTIGSRRSLGWALFWLGRAQARFHGDESRAAIEEALVIFRELGDPLGITWCLEWTALFAEKDHRIEDAEADYEESLEIGVRTGFTHATGAALGSLGAIAALKGNYERGVELTAAAVEHYRKARDQWQLTGALRRHALAHASLGQLSTAADLLEEAIDLAIEYSLEGQLGYALGNVVLIVPDQMVKDVDSMFSAWPYVEAQLWPDPRMVKRAGDLTERYPEPGEPMTADRVRDAIATAKSVLQDIRLRATDAQMLAP
jgi:predicted ATPase/class 3 adenylate cyclase/tetratricopeptide (TPR) repeat protein